MSLWKSHECGPHSLFLFLSNCGFLESLSWYVWKTSYDSTTSKLIFKTSEFASLRLSVWRESGGNGLIHFFHQEPWIQIFVGFVVLHLSHCVVLAGCYVFVSVSLPVQKGIVITLAYSVGCSPGQQMIAKYLNLQEKVEILSVSLILLQKVIK